MEWNMVIKHYQTFKELFCGTQIFLILSNKCNKYFYNRYCKKKKKTFSWCNQAGGIEENREKLKSESKQLRSEGFAKIKVSKCSHVHY